MSAPEYPGVWGITSVCGITSFPLLHSSEQDLPLVPIELYYWMVFKQQFSILEAMPCEMDTQIEELHSSSGRGGSFTSSHFAFTETQTLTNPTAGAKDSSQQTE